MHTNFAEEWVEKRLEMQELTPKRCPKENDLQVRKHILDLLSSHDLMNLSTVSPEGFPIVDCMHYVSVESEHFTPIFYLFTHDQTRKLVNLAKNPQIGISIYNYSNISFENRDQGWCFQFTGVGRVVNDLSERNQAIEVTRQKSGFGFASNLPLEQQPCICVYPLFGTWVNQKDGPPMTIDYHNSVD